MDDWGVFREIALRWMLLDLTDNTSTLVHVMAWCRQVTNHYLSQCWPSSMLHMTSLGHKELNTSLTHECLSLISDCQLCYIWAAFVLWHLNSFDLKQHKTLSYKISQITLLCWLLWVIIPVSAVTVYGIWVVTIAIYITTCYYVRLYFRWVIICLSRINTDCRGCTYNFSFVWNRCGNKCRLIISLEMRQWFISCEMAER